MAGPWLGAFIALIVATIIVGMPQAVRAQSPSGRRWLVLASHLENDLVESDNQAPADQTPADQIPADQITDARAIVELALRKTGYEVLENDRAARVFERIHSSEPVRLSPNEVEEAKERILAATRHLSYGEMEDATRELEAIGDLREAALEFLNRETELARSALDGCLTGARLLLQHQRDRQAFAHATDCHRSHPGISPHREQHPSAVLKLFERAKTELRAVPPATVRVTTDRKQPCDVRFNGIKVGRTPLELRRFRPGGTRIQVECGKRAGRVHRVSLHSGLNEIDVDMQVEHAIDTRGGLISMRYQNLSEEDASMVHVAREVGRATGVTDVFLVRNLGAVKSATDRMFEIHHIPVETGRVRSSARAPAIHLSGATRAVLRGQSLDFSSDEPEPIEPFVAPSSNSSVERGVASVSRKQHPRRNRIIAGASTLAVGAILGATATGLFFRYRNQTAEQTDPFEPGFDEREDARIRTRRWMLATGAFASAALTATVPLFTPERDGVPWYSWLIGAAGVGVGVLGVFYEADEGCEARAQPREGIEPGCIALENHHDVGSLLIMASVPLITAPLTHLVRAWFGRRSKALAPRVELDREHLAVGLQGRF